MKLTLNIWRQPSLGAEGRMHSYDVDGISPDMSFLEMLDVLNEGLIAQGEEPVAFDSDCREGICGMCSAVVNGIPHGGQQLTTLCQLHMRKFKDGDAIYIEPWRARAFPILKDLMVDRGALDKLIQAAGWVSCHTGGVADGNAILVGKREADYAMDAAECIGCGACVAACKNASAMLFTAAKVSHLSQLPQGQPERQERVLAMIARHDEEGFGSCTNTSECEAACPANISVSHIARLNREYFKAMLTAK